MRKFSRGAAKIAGTSVAIAGGMAAVMALVFLFALASVGLMLKIAAGSLTLATGFAVVCFVALASGVFIGTMIQAKHWEGDNE